MANNLINNDNYAFSPVGDADITLQGLGAFEAGHESNYNTRYINWVEPDGQNQQNLSISDDGKTLSSVKTTDDFETSEIIWKQDMTTQEVYGYNNTYNAEFSAVKSFNTVIVKWTGELTRSWAANTYITFSNLKLGPDWEPVSNKIEIKDSGSQDIWFDYQVNTSNNTITPRLYNSKSSAIAKDTSIGGMAVYIAVSY